MRVMYTSILCVCVCVCVWVCVCVCVWVCVCGWVWVSRTWVCDDDVFEEGNKGQLHIGPNGYPSVVNSCLSPSTHPPLPLRQILPPPPPPTHTHTDTHTHTHLRACRTRTHLHTLRCLGTCCPQHFSPTSEDTKPHLSQVSCAHVHTYTKTEWREIVSWCFTTTEISYGLLGTGVRESKTRTAS